VTTKIAPLLTAMVAEYAKHRDLDMHGRTWAEAQRELRALRACAKALVFALNETDARLARRSVGGMVIHEETPGLAKARKAAARLSHASNPRRKR